MFGDDMSLAARLILALVVILALIGFIVLILRRLGVGGLGAISSHGRQPRLAVMDMAHLDSRRKLVIVRRDTVEHLLMIGGPNDIVIERGIVRGQPVAHPHEQTPAARSVAPASKSTPAARITPAFSTAEASTSPQPANEVQGSPTSVEDETSKPLPNLEPPAR